MAQINGNSETNWSTSFQHDRRPIKRPHSTFKSITPFPHHIISNTQFQCWEAARQPSYQNSNLHPIHSFPVQSQGFNQYIRSHHLHTLGMSTWYVPPTFPLLYFPSLNCSMCLLSYCFIQFCFQDIAQNDEQSTGKYKRGNVGGTYHVDIPRVWRW